MSALPEMEVPPSAPPAVDTPVAPVAAEPSKRRRGRSAQILPFRQDEDVIRSFFADTVAPTPAYGMRGWTRASLITIAAAGAGGAFIAAASQFLEF
ncbi:hypothetical protein QLH51_02110 [Sphingomonas sp. 2R-10]|jgi:hypothetical protein|uniref:hypothetical protein n=1 Tax=Sphingomonas sp. 2R-10 TaxID=3045148 RepID=UPI000F77D030|nr:hypothetical protein [Sphingomonas sp. 2R-10]MDJ0275602.1 hypothetical protein [Sphingomonas sp. 2R-10]